MGGREVREEKEYGQIFDPHFVEFGYPSGAIISSQCRHQTGCLTRVAESFQGILGTSETCGANNVILKTHSGETIYKHNIDIDKNPYQVEHDKLFVAIRSGEVINNVEYGAKSTMTAILGSISTYSGKQIIWDEAMATNLKLVLDKDTLSFDSTPPVVPNELGIYLIPIPSKTTFI